MPQSPMISCPLKQTSEVDWIQPLKAYIRDTYQDDPERYSEECGTLNRLRQDMRGAGRDSASGRDLLYRYYGQLELLDLRFPVDENHIKISFTWFDAFTHKPISQYSLAYEKASIIFNISAVLCCHAANQNRADDTGLKTAYHSFQASAGMFNYINENFLHAPSTDLSRDTVKTLIAVTLAQGQEVFLEKQLADGKKAALLAKLASQAATLYAQAAEGAAEQVARQVFDKSWLLLAQAKASLMSSLAQYHQALADAEAGAHGVAIARLQIAEREAKDASRVATQIPASPAGPAASLAPDAAVTLADMAKRHLAQAQERLAGAAKDNDFIYHQPVPAEAALAAVPKLPAAKAIPVSELYQGQDIQRIIGPDIFARIVPMAVTESASLYDEEKAKLVRAEAERAEQADDEMAASLDYLKLPGSLDVLKGGSGSGSGGGGADGAVPVDPEFRHWCEALAGQAEPFAASFEALQADRAAVAGALAASAKQLDLEENVCEKMRVKYAAAWTQQPSARLNATLRSDVRSYRAALDEAAGSDARLLATARAHEADFDEMRSAGETDEADVLYQSAMIKAGGSRGKGRTPQSPAAEGNLLDEDYGEGGMTVLEQIARIEDMLKKLNLIKKDRAQVLKDLKEKVHNDDISNVLILNKKSIANHETKLFEAELEKFRPHQNRLLQAGHKQAALMKELTRAYGELLQDRRVRAEQGRADALGRQRAAVLARYRKVHAAFADLTQGLERARAFYAEMRATVDNLDRNVEAFVDNRRDEGALLLAQIERKKPPPTSSGSGSGAGSAEASRAAAVAAAKAAPDADLERERLRELMDRMHIGAGAPSPPRRSPSVSQQQQQPTRRTPQPAAAYGYGPPAASPAYQHATPQPAPAGVPPPAAYQTATHSPSPPVPVPHAYPPYNGAPAGYPPDPYHHHATHPAFDPAMHPPFAYAHPAQHPQHPQHPQYPPQGPIPHQQQQQPQQQQQQQPKSPPAWGYPPYGPGGGPPLPQGYVPPPPPPGPPPGGAAAGGYAPQPPQQQHPAASPPQPMQFQYPGAQPPGGPGSGGPVRQGSAAPQGDPWAGLGAWR